VHTISHINAAKYTKREVRDAAAARELMRKLGDPTPGDMCERLRIGKIKNVTVTLSDVWRFIAIWGKSGASIKAKTTTHKAPVVKFERLPVDDVQKHQELQVDLMFVDKVAFLLGVSIPMKYTFLAPLASRAQSPIWPALKQFILLPRSREITVDIVRTDPEGGVVSSESELAELGCEFKPGGSKETIPVVEGTIRTITERVRGIINTLPYTLPYCLVAALCIFVVQRLNMFPPSTSLNAYSPRELMWNRIVDAKTDLALGFGDYVQAHRNIEDNTLEPRTDKAIALYPTGNLEGTLAFFNLNTNRVVKRNHWTSVPLDQSVVEHMNSLAGKQKRRLPEDVRFCRGVTEVEDDIDEPDPVDQTAGEMIRRAEDIVVDIPPEYDHDYVEDDLDGVSVRSTPSLVLSDQPIEDVIDVEEAPTPVELPERDMLDGTGPIEEVASATGLVEVAPEVVSEPRYNLRPTRPPPGTWSTKSLSQSSFGLHLSTRAAIKTYGKVALAAMRKEMSQILEKETIRGVKFTNLSSAQRRRIIRSHMFIKEKYLPTGVCEKLKARFVAGGDGQDRSLYSESQLSSKVSTTSVFLVAALAAKEKRTVAVVDFPGAYLNSEMPKDGKKVHMKLDQYMTGVLVSLDPSYKEFVNEDGTCVVRVVKGLYGLIEAAD
jgi:hypothetical protein